MVFVKKNPGQSDDQVIKLFSRRATDANIVQEYKDRRYHLNKQEKKKLADQHLRRQKRRASQ
jgi:ribosomal protein S21